MFNKWSKEYKDHCYPEIYLYTFAAEVGMAFEIVASNKCDTFLTMDYILTSHIFDSILDCKNPLFLNFISTDILSYMEYNERFDWKKTRFKGKGDDEYVANWTGKVLTYYQWAYRINFQHFIEYMSSEDVYNMFYPLHEAPMTKAIDIVKDNYDCRVRDNKKRKNFTMPKHFFQYFDDLQGDVPEKLVEKYGKDENYWNTQIFQTRYVKKMILPKQSVNFDSTDEAFNIIEKQLKELKIIK